MSGNEGLKKQSLGRFGEDKAADYLISEGFEILERNFRCRSGEVDIICKNSEYIVFAEVKLRKNDRFGSAMEFVTYTKQRKVITASEYYVMKNMQGAGVSLQPRFDVIEVYAPHGEAGDVCINHIEDAFSVNF